MRRRESSIKYLGVWIDENLTWRNHRHTVENKITKNIRLLYQGKHYLDEKCLKQIYFAYINAYINYANIAWACTHKTKLKKLQSKQKHALRIIFNQSKTLPSKSLFLSLNVLNVHQFNIFQSMQFMHKIKNKNAPHISLNLFGVPCHVYPTNFSLINFSEPQMFLKTARFAISARGPILWNICFSKNEEEIGKFLLFKRRDLLIIWRICWLF